MKDDEKKTSSHINIPPYFTEYQSTDLPKPGEFPYTRGVHENMYRGKVWTMRQYAGFSTAKQTNVRFKELLGKGAKGLSCAFDLPTQMGLDSDDSMSLGEVGKVGVAIDSIEDMRMLFDGIDMGQVSTSMTINATAAILLCLYECVAEEKGVASQELRGTVQNDVLKEYIARGTYIYPPEDSLRIITDMFDYCHKNIPKWNTISISGYHIREAGSTAVQEVAFTLANGRTYVQKALEKGLDIDDFAPRLSFFFNVHNNFLEEIAKFRAARKIWAEMMKNEFGAKKEKSMMLRFHSQVAGSTLTAQQPLNNTMRVALQALASVLGGTQSLHTNGYDEALQLPTSKSAELALRTQQIIAHESGVVDFVDPLGGSYAIEYLTDQIEKGVKDYFSVIESKGGVISCINDGFIQSEIMEAAYQAQLRIERGEDLIVGMNCYTESEKTEIPSNKISDSIEKEQVQRLAKFKKNRDPQKVSQLLAELEQTAKGKNNIVVAIKNCVKGNCTLGEISSAMKNVFGKYQPKVGL